MTRLYYSCRNGYCNHFYHQKWFKKTIKIIPIILLIAIMCSILIWSNKKDKEIQEWAELYERCVMNEYKTTPWEYHFLNGEYPKCNYKIEIQKVK